MDISHSNLTLMSLLTFQRPNFCCLCGNKIIRLRWYPWTSRKFCGVCGHRFRKEQFVQPLLAVGVLLLLGIFIGRAMRSNPPPLVIQRTIASTTVATSSQAPAPQLVEEDVYICGARTRKGTPCSRRVHGPVRCWQHKGLPAMLPLEKLKIKD